MVDNSIVVESCFRSTKGKGIVGYREAPWRKRHCAAVHYRKYRDHLCCIPARLLLQGLTGQMFKPFGLYDHLLYGGIPHQCNDHRSALLHCFYRPQEKEESPVGALIRTVQNGYRSIMKVLLKKKKTVLFTSVAFRVAAFWMASQLRMELMVSG